MKKQRFSILLLVTLLFAAFTVGLYCGRSSGKTQVSVTVSRNMQTLPPETTVPETVPEETAPAITYPININTADKDTLTALPGIGDVLAQRILDYREEHGSFTHVEELLNVEGIGERKMETIVDLITIGGSL